MFVTGLRPFPSRSLPVQLQRIEQISKGSVPLRDCLTSSSLRACRSCDSGGEAVRLCGVLAWPWRLSRCSFSPRGHHFTCVAWRWHVGGAAVCPTGASPQRVRSFVLLGRRHVRAVAAARPAHGLARFPCPLPAAARGAFSLPVARFRCPHCPRQRERFVLLGWEASLSLATRKARGKASWGAASPPSPARSAPATDQPAFADAPRPS